MSFDKILAVPFLLPSSGLLTSKDLESVETAIALLLIELERKKEEELASISRFFCPLWVYPIDESKALIFDGSDFTSSKINLPILDFEAPPNLDQKNFLSFVDELEKYVKVAVSEYQSKPRGVRVRGWLGEDFTSEIKELLPKIEEWTNVKPFEIIEPTYTIDKAYVEESGLEWFPTKSLIEREKQKHKATLEIIDSRIQEASEEFKSLKSDFKEKEANLKEEAKEKIEAEEEKKERQIAQISESKFERKMPRPGATLYHLLRDVSEHSETVRTIVENEDVYEILDEISNIRDKVDELRDYLRNLEAEYTTFKKEVDKFYTDKDREIKRIEAEFEKRKKEIEAELEEKLENLSSEIEDYEDALETARTLREELAAAFESWKDKTEKAIIEYEEISIPLKRLPSDQTLLLFVPFYVAEYRKKQKKSYEVVPPVTITEKKKIIRLKAISRLAEEYRNEIEKGKAHKNFELGLKNYNYLLNPEIAQMFSKGINILEKLEIIDSNTATRIKNAYDQHFRIKLEE